VLHQVPCVLRDAPRLCRIAPQHEVMSLMALRKKYLILRCLAKRGLEGGTTFFQPCRILAQPRSAFHRSPRPANRVPGGTFFFTVNLFDRRSNLLVAQIDAVRDAVRQVRARAPFSYRCLGRPSRPHALSVDVTGRRCRFSRSLAGIKTALAKSLPIGEPRSPVMTRRGKRGIWQRRYGSTRSAIIATSLLTWTARISTQ
jgi:hypothetical protein